jgi:hypothetical protein
MTMAKLLILSCILFSAGCATTKIQVELPKELKRYENTPTLKLITADGVRIKSRELENYPKGDLDFWSDALKTHLDHRGYVFKTKRCFETTPQKLQGCTLEFVVARGPEDWLFTQTLFVDGEKILLIEAAAPFDRLTKLEPSYTAALKTLVLEH